MVKHRDFNLQEYNSGWTKTFEENSKVIEEIYGDHLVSINHIGSTSIPGMLAKPQIDIVVEVKDIDKVPSFYNKMEEAGFKSMGRKYTRRPDNEYFVKDSAEGKRMVSVHTYQVGNEEVKKLLAFRDYLRANEGARKIYIEKKKDLYNKYSDDYPAYRKGKFELIEELKEKALQWRISE